MYSEGTTRILDDVGNSTIVGFTKTGNVTEKTLKLLKKKIDFLSYWVTTTPPKPHKSNPFTMLETSECSKVSDSELTRRDESPLL